jgi:hypothetical protein
MGMSPTTASHKAKYLFELMEFIRHELADVNFISRLHNKNVSRKCRLMKDIFKCRK